MTFGWKVPSDFGGGKEEVVEADKMSMNSFERLNAREKSRNALEIVRETYAPPILLPVKRKIIEIEAVVLVQE